jgi:hypothetical protein
MRRLARQQRALAAAQREARQRAEQLERDAFWQRYGELLAAQGIGVWVGGRYYAPGDRP